MALISDKILNPAGEPVAGLDISFSAIDFSNTPTGEVVRGSTKVVTTSATGSYSINLVSGSYRVKFGTKVYPSIVVITEDTPDGSGLLDVAAVTTIAYTEAEQLLVDVLNARDEAYAAVNNITLTPEQIDEIVAGIPGFSETLTTIVLTGNVLSYTDEDSVTHQIDLGSLTYATVGQGTLADSSLQPNDVLTPITASNKLVTESDITSFGDMNKSVYDTNNSGKVDQAENANTVNNLTVQTAVPLWAIFTDTVTEVQDILTSIEAEKAHSANQGRILKGFIDSANLLIQQNHDDLQSLDLGDIAETTSLKHFTQVLLDKLNSLDVGVTVQPYNASTVVDAGYVHTDNNFTTTEKNRLAQMEDKATADQTGAEIADLIDVLLGSQDWRTGGSVYDDSDVLKDEDALSPVTPSNKLMTQTDVSALGGGDMLKSIYDSNNSGVVDSAESVEWSGVQSTPTTLVGYGITDAYTKTEVNVMIPTVPTVLSAFTNDSGYITGYTVTEADVTAHQAALSITESQVSDFGNYLKNIQSAGANLMRFTFRDNSTFDLDLSSYLDDTNLSRLVSGVYDAPTQSLIFTRDDSSTFSVDASMFFDDTNLVTSVDGQTGSVDLSSNYEPVIAVKNTAFNKNFGSTAGTVCEGNDSRLSDARTPTAHTHSTSEVTGLDDALNDKLEANDYATDTTGGTIKIRYDEVTDTLYLSNTVADA